MPKKGEEIMSAKIADLPMATDIPKDDEFICPVYLDNTNCVLCKISIPDLINEIKSRVIAGNEIEIITTDFGIKFRSIRKK